MNKGGNLTFIAARYGQQFDASPTSGIKRIRNPLRQASDMTKYERISLLLSGGAIVVSLMTAAWQIFESTTVRDSLYAEYEYQVSNEGIALNLALTNFGKEKLFVKELSSGYIKGKHFTSNGIGGEYDLIATPLESGELRTYQWEAVAPNEITNMRARLRNRFFITLVTSRGQRITLSDFDSHFEEAVNKYESLHRTAN